MLMQLRRVSQPATSASCQPRWDLPRTNLGRVLGSCHPFLSDTDSKCMDCNMLTEKGKGETGGMVRAAVFGGWPQESLRCHCSRCHMQSDRAAKMQAKATGSTHIWRRLLPGNIYFLLTFAKVKKHRTLLLRKQSRCKSRSRWQKCPLSSSSYFYRAWHRINVK
jgi:hypothetical protein